MANKEGQRLRNIEAIVYGKPRIGIDSDGYGAFIWWPHGFFYHYAKGMCNITERDWLDGIHEFTL